jgi:hypothetical protein
MWNLSQGGRGTAETVTLEAHAACAGAALACVYSNSAELDAAVIAARRAAGVYGPKRRRKQMLTTAAGIMVGLALIIFLVV